MRCKSRCFRLHRRPVSIVRLRVRIDRCQASSPSASTPGSHAINQGEWPLRLPGHMPHRSTLTGRPPRSSAPGRAGCLAAPSRRLARCGAEGSRRLVRHSGPADRRLRSQRRWRDPRGPRLTARTSVHEYRSRLRPWCTDRGRPHVLAAESFEPIDVDSSAFECRAVPELHDHEGKANRAHLWVMGLRYDASGTRDSADATRRGEMAFPSDKGRGAATSHHVTLPRSSWIVTGTNPALSSKVTVSDDRNSPNSPALARTNAVPTFG